MAINLDRAAELGSVAIRFKNISPAVLGNILGYRRGGHPRSFAIDLKADALGAMVRFCDPFLVFIIVLSRA